MIEQLGAGALGLGILAAGIFNGWQTVQAKREAKVASNQAQRAADNAHPISNGWGTQLRDDVAATRRTLERINESMALNERRQITQDERIQAMDERLANHIDNHPRALEATA